MIKKISKLTGSMAFLLAMGACSLGPTYERPAPPASNTPSGKASTGAESIAAADIGWRDFIREPRLQALVELALKNDRDLRVALLNVQSAKAEYQVAQLAFLPSVNAVGSKSASRTPTDLVHNGGTPIESSYSVGGQTSWEIDLFGHALSLKHEALADYLAIAQNRKAAQITLVAAVANQYVLLQAANAQINLSRETIIAAQEALRLTKMRLDAGVSSELDVEQAETTVAIGQANLQNQLASRARVINGLTLLVGEPLPDELPPGKWLADSEFLSDIPAGMPSDLIERRPDIVSAEQSLIAANADIGAARAAFFPSVSLTGSLGSESPQLRNLFGPGSTSWSFAPTINLPILQGGQLRANLELSAVRKKIKVATYEKTIQTAFQEVADGLVARATYDRQVEHLMRDESAQRRNFELEEQRYRQGVDSAFGMITAQQSLYAVQEQLVAARQERLTNLVDLYQALGGGWVEHTSDKARPADS